MEEIKRLMLELAQEATNREIWDKTKPTGVVGKKRKEVKGENEQL
jgi:hypothetical protein